MLKFLGRGSGFSKSNNSAYIEYAGSLILIDCGVTVFNEVRKNLDLSKYNSIYVIITHLHSDHAGSLGQLIMYLGYELSKKPIIVSECENIQNFLNIIGIDRNLYRFNPNAISGLSFIKTHHTDLLDAYGFVFEYEGKKIVYTGDTSTLIPFRKAIKGANELYVDVSKKGIVHLQIDDVLLKLLQIQDKGTKVYLMHLDDEEYIAEITQGKLEFANIKEEKKW